MKENFGIYLKNLRNQNNLTLTQMAARLDLDSANLCKIENGKRDLDENRLDKLATIFSLDIEILRLEYFSSLIAKKIYDSKCSEKVLKLAEEKLKYLYQQEKETSL